MRVIFKGIVVCLLVVLAGCAKVKQDPIPVIPWKNHYKAVNEFKNWNIDGKISITDGKDRYSAIVDWSQVGPNYRIKFKAPIGTQYIIISKLDDGKYRLVSHEGRLEEASSVEDILLREVGWSISLNGFESWVKGIPYGLKRDAFILNKYRKLEQLNQDGWEITYDIYKRYKNLYLPTRVNFEHKSKGIRIKLLIRNWY